MHGKLMPWKYQHRHLALLPNTFIACVAWRFFKSDLRALGKRKSKLLINRQARQAIQNVVKLSCLHICSCTNYILKIFFA